MTETPPHSEQPANKRRKRNSSKGDGKKTAVTGVQLIKLGLIAGAAALVGSKAVDYMGDVALESKLNEMRDSLPIVGKDELSQSQKETFSMEGWSENFLPAFNEEAVDQVTVNTLNELEIHMETSVFAPFRDTISYLKSFVNVDVSGKITKMLSRSYKDSGGGYSIYTTAFALDTLGRIDSRISANPILFSPSENVEPGFLVRGTWALGLNHEIYHHMLGLKTFDFWQDQGLSVQDAFSKVINDDTQEPYAYWNQAAATSQLFAAGLTQQLPESMLRVVDNWRRINRQGLKWYDPEWVDFIKSENSFSSINTPWKEANLQLRDKIFAGKPISEVI